MFLEFSYARLTELSVEVEYLMNCILLIVCFTNCLPIVSVGSLPFSDPGKSTSDSSIMHERNSSFEPPRGKTNNLHRRKQRRRSASRLP